jgi:catechol 2,3-dioxygenase-like lactoylglutathione lyase family enzyme
MGITMTGHGADIGITARDPEGLVGFYGGFLGLHLSDYREWPESAARVWFFAVGDGHLKILAFDDAPQAVNPPGGNRGASGYRYIALHVEDVSEVLTGLETAGGRLQSPVADHGQSRVVFVEDPEGNTIEFVQRHDSPGQP